MYKINENPIKRKSKRKYIDPYDFIFKDQKEIYDTLESEFCKDMSCKLNYKPEYEITKINFNHYQPFYNPNGYTTDFDYCETCVHNLWYDEERGNYICKECFMETESRMLDEYNNQVYKCFSDVYDRNAWTTRIMDLILGKRNEEITDQFWYSIIKQIPENFTWYKVFKIFQKNYSTDYWYSFGSYIGMNIKLNKKILYYTEQYTNEKVFLKRIKYEYLLYKFTQLYGEEGDEKYVPNRVSKAWLKEKDIWWKKICERDDIPFIPSKIHIITWNKKEILKDLEDHLKINNANLDL